MLGLSFNSRVKKISLKINKHKRKIEKIKIIIIFHFFQQKKFPSFIE